MLLALALVRAASAYLLSGTSCRACRTAARMTATVDAAWDIGTDIEGAEGAVACHAVFAELAASPAFASETWARRPLLLSSPSADFAGAFTMDDVEAAVESDFLDAGTPLLLNRLPTPCGPACPPSCTPACLPYARQAAASRAAAAAGRWRKSARRAARLTQRRRCASATCNSRSRAAPWSSTPQATTLPRAAAPSEPGCRPAHSTAATLRTLTLRTPGFNIPKLASVSLAALDAFGLPNCLNLYLTAAGQQISAPPHTDKQARTPLSTPTNVP